MKRVCLVALVAVAGCAGAPVMRPSRGELVAQGISQPGVVIEAVDGSFRLESDRQFQSPFVSNCAGTSEWSRTEVNLKQWVDRRAAKAVRVTYPGIEQPLYGVFALCSVHSKYRGPVSRSYRVGIPEHFVAETDQGRISVVYEKYQLSHKGIMTDYPAWILWLSRDPIP